MDLVTHSTMSSLLILEPETPQRPVIPNLKSPQIGSARHTLYPNIIHLSRVDRV